MAGQFFQDSQGRSYVLVEDTGQDEPDPSQNARRRRSPDADADADAAARRPGSDADPGAHTDTHA